jgi:hypothetical protein
MTTSTDILRQRRRLAEEQLVGSSSWRDGLTDPQAQRLLDWALDFVNELVWQTAVLPADEADKTLDDAVTAVANIMRQINRLTNQLPQLNPDSARKELQTLTTAYQALIGQAPDAEKTEQLVYLLPAWDNNAVFEQLYTLIAWEQEEE